MIFSTRCFCFLLIFISFFLYSSSVSAFGLKTHLWIGTRLLEDVKDDCKIDVRGNLYAVESDVCNALRNNAGNFLSGTLGPDIYPDLVTGQTTTHPGVEGGWQTDGFLNHLLNSAEESKDLAFSLGFLTHAAGDTFAHTYVNNYAGDEFVLYDEVTVERRHFVLEKYIDARLPGNFFGADDLTIPADFVRDTLIHNNKTANQYIRSGSGIHLAAMTGVYQSVTDAVNAAESIEQELSDVLADLVVKHVEIGTQIATGEATLIAAEETLRVHEQTLSVRRRALTSAQQNLNRAISTLERANRLFADATSHLRQMERAVSIAQRALNDANRQLARQERQLTELQRRLANTPTHIVDRVCEDVQEQSCHLVCPRFVPGCDRVCDTVTKEVCKNVSRANGAWRDLNNRVAGARNQLTTLRSNVTRKSSELAAAQSRRGAALADRARKGSELATAGAARTAANTAFNTARAAVDAEQRLVSNARREVERARKGLANLRENLIDTEKGKEVLSKLLDNLDLLSFFLKNWVKGMDNAGEEYVKTGLRVSQGMLRGHSGLFEEYKNWLVCHGNVYLSTPYQVANAPCEAEALYQKFQARLDELEDQILPEPIKEVRNRIDAFKKRVKEKIDEAVMDATIKIIAFVTDETTADFVDLLANPENATRKKLIEVFTPEEEKSGKNLLAFENVATLIDSDLGLKGNKIDAQHFKALDYALVLAKLALLQPNELNRLIADFSREKVGNLHTITAETAGFRPSQPINFRLVEADVTDENVSSLYTITAEPGKRYSILVNSLRSIDGNHQWQPYGLPYPRTTGHDPEPKDADERHHGYGGNSDGHGTGFPLFINTDIRDKVFLKLFPEPMIGEIGKLKEMQQDGGYPFPTCDQNPFPVTFKKDGSPKELDQRCD